MGETLAIHLLGPQPSVVRSGQPQPPPRGRKVWALLAYLLITESAPSREWLSELLFSDADDPLNALSWNLTQLRRLLGPESSIGGEPVVLRLPPGTFVDVHALTTGTTWMHATGIPGLGRELLGANPTRPARASRRGCRQVADTWPERPRACSARQRQRNSRRVTVPGRSKRRTAGRDEPARRGRAADPDPGIRGKR
jgi:hypothetical protein